MNICFSMVICMIMIYNFALSTHLIVDTGCQFYLHMSYISIFALLPEMYARVCDRCVYGYAIIIYVIILTSQFYNYIDHTYGLQFALRGKCRGKCISIRQPLLYVRYGTCMCSSMNGGKTKILSHNG